MKLDHRVEDENNIFCKGTKVGGKEYSGTKLKLIQLI